MKDVHKFEFKHLDFKPTSAIIFLPRKWWQFWKPRFKVVDLRRAGDEGDSVVPEAEEGL